MKCISWSFWSFFQTKVTEFYTFASELSTFSYAWSLINWGTHSVRTSPYESLLGGPPPGWGTRFYFLKNVYQYLTKPSRRCHSWVCLTSLFISSGLGRTIIQDILLLAFSSELCNVLRDTGIYKLYIYEQNSCLVLLNLSTFRGM